MTYRWLLMVPIMVMGLGLGSALAAPGASLGNIGIADESLVHKTHGCHRSCEWGPAGWHRHAGPYCARVGCYPRAWYPGRCFVDRWGVRHCRW